MTSALHFAVTGLKPGTRYQGEFFNEAGTTLFEGCRFDTVTASLPAVTRENDTRAGFLCIEHRIRRALDTGRKAKSRRLLSAR
jgi:hypothetical protein